MIVKGFRWLVPIVMLMTIITVPARAYAASTNFSIPESVSPSDAEQVRTGVEFARGYLAETYRQVTADDLTVNVRPNADPSIRSSSRSPMAMPWSSLPVRRDGS